MTIKMRPMKTAQREMEIKKKNRKKVAKDEINR
jgi:hypothetical protein